MYFALRPETQSLPLENNVLRSSSRMARSSAVDRKVLSNGAVTVSQIVRYGTRKCEVLFTILPGTSVRAENKLAGEIALQQIAELKYEKQRAADIDAEAARMFYHRVNTLIASLRSEGYSLPEIAVRLNQCR